MARMVTTKHVVAVDRRVLGLFDPDLPFRSVNDPAHFQDLTRRPSRRRRRSMSFPPLTNRE